MNAASRSAGLIATAVVLINGRPSPALRFFLVDAALLVTLCDMIGFAFLFVGIFGFVAAWHSQTLLPQSKF